MFFSRKVLEKPIIYLKNQKDINTNSQDKKKEYLNSGIKVLI